MSTHRTANYGLPLENDDTFKFKRFREDINGIAANSGMNLIDAALAGKADEIEYNDEEGTLQLKSLGQPLGDPVPGGNSKWGSFSDLIADEDDSETQAEP